MLITETDHLSEVVIDNRKFIDKTIVLSRTQAIEFECRKPWIAISISSYKDFARLHAENRIALLQLAFPDLDLPRVGWDLFSAEQANQVYNFIQPLWEVSDVLMVHCDAGLSRSPAIAAALHKVFVESDNNEYWKRYIPNAHVYKTMLHVAIERAIWDPAARPDTPHHKRRMPDPAAEKWFDESS